MESDLGARAGGRRTLRGRGLMAAALPAWVVFLALLGFALHREWPGPADQAVHGLAIGSYESPGGVAYVSGRRLECLPVGREPLASRCRVEIAGRVLELDARRSPPGQFGGTCEARYAGTAWPCWIGGRHVHVQWFAHLPDALGLRPGELDAVRRANPVQNLPEEAFWRAIPAVTMLTAAVAAAGTAAALRAAGRRWPATAVVALLASLVSLAGTFALAVLMTNRFWD